MDWPLTPGEVIGGRYRLVKVLDESGVGVVVEATLLAGHSPLALYVYPPWLFEHQDLVAKLLDNARAVARLKSRHARQTFAGEVDEQGRPFVVAELLAGETAGHLVRRRGPLAPGRAAAYARQACEVLAEWHEGGRQHGELGTDDLFLASQRGGPPQVKLLGLYGARRLYASRAHNAVGMPRTPVYFSPEAIRGLKLDPRADVWSLGVVLYQMLSGSLPFGGESLVEQLKAIMLDPPRPLLEQAPAVPAGLAEVVHRCLERDLDRRIQGAAELASLLAAFG